MIADRSPEPEELATKADLREFRLAMEGELRVMQSDLLATKNELRADFAELKADIRGWMLSFFVPLWIGVYGTLGAVVISLIVRG